MPHVLITLESLMLGEGEESAAPDPEGAASTIDDMARPLLSSGGQSGGSSAAAQLEILPMDGLIASAWCGLAFWAMERAAPAPATAAASPAAAAAASSNESNSDDKDENNSDKGKGKGKGKPTAGSGGGDSSSSSAAPPKRQQGSATMAEGGGPLLLLLRWLLGGAADSSNGSGSEAATDKESAGGGRGAAEEVGLAAPTPDASAEKLTRWKASLLGALIHGLSRRLALSKVSTAPGTEAGDSGAKGNLGTAEQALPEQAWLDARVDMSSLYSGGSSTCPECALAGCVIRDAILREWGKTKDGDGEKKGGTAAGGKRDGEKREANPPSPRFPLWLVLLEGALRGRCGSNKHGGGDRRCHSAALLPRVFLAEALALSPRDWSGPFLVSLYKGVLFETEGEDLGTCVTEAEGDHIHGSGRTPGVLPTMRRQQEQCSALTVLGHAWRAEASRVLSGWKSRRLPCPNPSASGDRTTDVGLDGSVQNAGLLHSGSAAGAPVPQEPSSDQLRQDTGSTLLLLVRTASSLLSLSSPPPPETACNRPSRGVETRAAALGGDACAPGGRATAHDGERGGAREGEGVAENQASNRNLEKGRGRGWSQDDGRLAAAKAALGAESAGLWSEVFEARRNSHTSTAGFTRLVKHLAEACGSCALSAEAPKEAAVGPGASGGDTENLTGAWGLGFSQTQTQRQQAKGAVAFTAEVEKPAPAAAAAATAAAGARNTLAPPPPLFSLPVLLAAALALLRAAPKETKARVRGQAWKAGLATLAWALTSTPSTAEAATPTPPQPPRPQLAPASSSATTAAEEGATAADICRCFGAVRSTLAAAAAGTAADSSGVNWSSGTTFPLDQASLAPVSLLLADAVSRSYAVSAAPAASAAQVVSPEKMVGAIISTPCAAADAHVASASVAAIPSVRREVRSLVLCVLSAVGSFRPEVLEMSPGLLSALSPLLEAVMDLPASRCVGSWQYYISRWSFLGCTTSNDDL